MGSGYLFLTPILASVTLCHCCDNLNASSGFLPFFLSLNSALAGRFQVSTNI
jgi:hypothetical protein